MPQRTSDLSWFGLAESRACFLFHLQELILQTGTESPRKCEGERVARVTLGKQQRRLRLSAGDGIFWSQSESVNGQSCSPVLAVDSVPFSGLGMERQAETSHTYPPFYRPKTPAPGLLGVYATCRWNAAYIIWIWEQCMKRYSRAWIPGDSYLRGQQTGFC